MNLVIRPQSKLKLTEETQNSEVEDGRDDNGRVPSSSLRAVKYWEPENEERALKIWEVMRCQVFIKLVHRDENFVRRRTVEVVSVLTEGCVRKHLNDEIHVQRVENGT